jgi:hypothetical protein
MPPRRSAQEVHGRGIRLLGGNRGAVSNDSAHSAPGNRLKVRSPPEAAVTLDPGLAGQTAEWRR